MPPNHGPLFGVHPNEMGKEAIQPSITSSLPSIRLTTSTSTRAPRAPLGGVAIFFIVVATLIGCGLVCGAIYYLYRRWKRAKSSSPPIVSPPAAPVRDKALPTPATPHPRKPRSVPSAAPHPDRASVLPTFYCRKPLCSEYLARFKLPEAYFNPKHDKCFCQKCHETSNPDKRCGNWCTELHGWTLFGLRPSRVHAKEWRIFTQWDTSYYGTTSDRLGTILKNRLVPIDNDILDDGTKFVSGHRDQQYCTTSPSLTHASRAEFSPRSRFQGTDGNNYEVQVVLQCKQKPDTIIGKDDKKPFRKTEWKTKARGATVPTGLLVRLYKR